MRFLDPIELAVISCILLSSTRVKQSHCRSFRSLLQYHLEPLQLRDDVPKEVMVLAPRLFDTCLKGRPGSLTQAPKDVERVLMPLHRNFTLQVRPFSQACCAGDDSECV